MEGEQVRCKVRAPRTRDPVNDRMVWLPAAKALKGKKIELRCPADLWINGWTIVETYDRMSPDIELKSLKKYKPASVE